MKHWCDQEVDCAPPAIIRTLDSRRQTQGSSGVGTLRSSLTRSKTMHFGTVTLRKDNIDLRSWQDGEKNGLNSGLDKQYI